ncbi:MAG: CDP-alcohol phosphatidyltransferase family protein [Bacteroidales bacterium]|nr:CDP-alcohol phosphatidyltransferase family protein [Bacteroidales bacterium]
MNTTFIEIIRSLPEDKKAADGIWTKLVLRPLSYPITWILLRLNVSANFVSYTSILFSISGAMLFSTFHPTYSLIGALLLNFYAILDCVDGNIARVTRTSNPFGGWADAIMGHISLTATIFGLGIYSYFSTHNWIMLLLAGLTASSNLLMRTAYQAYKNIIPESAKKTVSLEMMIAETFGVTGLLMPALLIMLFTGGIEYLLFFNGLLYIGGCIVTIIKIAIKGQKTIIHNK